MRRRKIGEKAANYQENPRSDSRILRAFYFIVINLGGIHLERNGVLRAASLFEEAILQDMPRPDQ